MPGLQAAHGLSGYDKFVKLCALTRDLYKLNHLHKYIYLNNRYSYNSKQRPINTMCAAKNIAYTKHACRKG